MKFDPNKAWPYPVLRPRSFGNDYPKAAFEVEIDVEKTHGSTAVTVESQFYLSDPDLLGLVQQEGCSLCTTGKGAKDSIQESCEIV